MALNADTADTAEAGPLQRAAAPPGWHHVLITLPPGCLTSDTDNTADMASFKRLTQPTQSYDTARLARHGWRGVIRDTWNVQHDNKCGTIGTILTRGIADLGISRFSQLYRSQMDL